MSTRWFFSSARIGAAAASDGQALSTAVRFSRDIEGRREEPEVRGPTLSLVGPGDVLGFDRAMVLRQEPPPGTADAAENVLASVELAHADLPWLLSPGTVATPGGPTPQPWIVLVVLAEDEAAPPRAGHPLPVLTAPVAALPPLAERWAWTHVEARLPDDVTDVESARRLTEQGMRDHSAGVVGRLLCPRRLAPNRGWIAAVVPTTAAGRDAGLNAAPGAAATADAWPVPGRDTVDLPVYHWWTFRTGQAGTFEELARRLRFRPAAEAGLGTRIIDVRRPWPAEESAGPATVAMDGALRAPGTAMPETWSDLAAQDRFRALIRERVDAPALRRDEIVAAGDEEPVEDADVVAVAPPLYGGHHTGEQTVPAEPDHWMSTLNLEVRRRVAAALGARYAQLEQEFLMARAWEQVGAIRQANRLLAAGELAAVAAERAQHKHVAPLGAADLVTVMAPVSGRVPVSAAEPGAEGTTLATMLVAAPEQLPIGTASTSFVRLTRSNGAAARRARRGTNGGAGDGQAAEPYLAQKLAQLGLMGDGEPEAGLPGELRRRLDPLPLQVLRMADRIPAGSWTQRAESDRPLRPIMAHPKFTVPIAEELLARWPEWALPGIGALPPDSVTLLETNPEFIAALLVGLNHEFNRELLWREFPTDQRGTPFARFWPGDSADVEEIALWPPEAPLGGRLRTGGEGDLAMLVRGDLLRRFPGTALLAVRAVDGKLPPAFDGVPATPLVLDDSTVLYLFADLDEERARSEDWFFVFREPMRGTQFGFDSGEQPAAMGTWADLTWNGVGVDAARCVRLGQAPTTPTRLTQPDPPVWARDAADMARIAFQQPFQLAFRATTLLGG
ncbi:hypothetical protein [Streptomyces griseoloalbus]|uniref:Molybdopterin converting factor small subunit n=1 Tax=Streptomyces griseoloalbus TaxID=67303 RepID=A0A7W8F8V1_9ACTN|nr:hypothetical protein [Streptomyces albaduncus]MBB5124741.1 molybdopterin converting factor small subunit [Streptomyces albaduncus]GGW39079.1 hypothetical protein GCM10010340_16120 [Streptomyces albaduncus]